MGRYDWAAFNRDLTRAETDHVRVVRIVEEMIELLDEADREDFFGTEGWKHRLGLED